jgi:hypothetical protein
MADKKNYLDKTGLSHLWSKIKTYVSGARTESAKRLAPICAIGSDTASSAGWYKVADSTMSGYGNTTITYLVKSGYESSHAGILHLEMRSDSSKISCWSCKWLIRSGFSSGDIRIVINGMKWTMYVYNGSAQYGRIMFTILEHVSIGSNGGDPVFTVNHYNTNTKEATEPTATVSSSDGGTVNYANSAGTATKATQDANGVGISTGYLRQYSDYLNTHPENSGTILPFMNNDIAFLTERGGTAKVYYDGVEQTISTANMFDASSSYWYNNPTGITEVVIELTLHKVFTWTNTIYVDHGAAGWRAKNVKIETINSNYADDVWVARYTNTAQSKGNYFTTFGHTVVGQSNASGGFNKVRLTFSDWANSTIFRIAQIGIVNYGSAGLRETNMSRGIDDGVLRDITPYHNGKYNFGSATKRWLAGHFLKLVLYGSAADQPLMTRGIVGSDGNGATGELHLQYGVNQPIKLGNAAAYSISADGGTYSGTAAKATSATKAQYDKNGDDITSTYLKKAGDTFTGPIKWGGNTALPAEAGLKYILGIDAFADGGQTKYINIGDMSVGKAAKLTTARKINGVSFDGSADITLPNATTTANGMMSNTDKTKLDGIGELITKTVNLKLEAGVWTDTGISGNNLTSGTYIVQIKADFAGTAGLWDERFSGIMTWYSLNTNSGVSDEIVLHDSGHAPNAGKLYLRTIRQTGGSSNVKLQISSKIAMASAKDIVFYFRKMI